MNQSIINIHGHRGARGLYPENTLISFIEAVKAGANTLEMDLVISKDRQVVVSHEAWMNELFCSSPSGIPLASGSGQTYNLYKMNYDEIRRYDCGKRGNAEFPLQKATPAHKPLFSEVVEKVENFLRQNNLPFVSYNIEIKTELPDGVFNPAPEEFAELVYREIVKHNISERLEVQSFDVRMLRQIHGIDANIRTGLLVENNDSLEANINKLGFVPDFYNPELRLVNKNLVEKIHQRGMKINVWTVNENNDLKALLLLGVDGIITDYPQRAVKLLEAFSRK